MSGEAPDKHSEECGTRKWNLKFSAFRAVVNPESLSLQHDYTSRADNGLSRLLGDVLPQCFHILYADRT
jgi:hypothetical protein